MKKRLAIVLAAGCAFAMAEQANAAQVIYAVTGQLTAVGSAQLWGDTLVVGDAYQLQVTLEDSVDYATSENVVEYDIVGWDLSLDGGTHTITWSSTDPRQYTFNLLNGIPEVNSFPDTINIDSPFDYFGALPLPSGTSTVFTEFYILEDPDWTMRTRLQDDSGTALTSTDLLPSFPVSSFNDLDPALSPFRLSLGQVLIFDPDRGYIDRFIELQGDISSKTVVPLPPAVWLFGSGLLGLAGIARRRKAVLM